MSRGIPRAVTPEGTRDGRFSPDGRQILARGSDGSFSLYPIEGGEAQATRGFATQDDVIHWCVDGRSVLVIGDRNIPRKTEPADLETGRRELFREVAPSDLTGVVSIRPTFVTEDEQSHAYTVGRRVSSLLVSESRLRT